MGIKKRLIWIVAGSGFLLFFLLVVIFYPMLLQQFRSIEEQAARESMDRLAEQIQQEQEQLLNFNQDWSSWDDTLAFVERGGQDESYIESNLDGESLNNGNLSFMMIVDKNEEILFSQSQNEAGEAESGFEALALTETEVLDTFSRLIIGETNLYQYGDKAYMVSALPIQATSTNSGSNGTMIMGREINGSYIEMLADSMQVPLTFQVLAEEEADGNASRISSSDRNLVHSEYRLPYANTSNAASFVFEQPRTIYNQGAKTINLLLVSFTSGMILLTVLLIFLLNRSILKRIAFLSGNLNTIEQKGVFEDTVTVDGNDEITVLQKSANRLICSLRSSHQEMYDLAYRDPVTNLYNRYYLLKELSSQTNQKQPFSLLFIDLDHFKKVNDTFGHHAGDEVLRETSRRMNTCAPNGTTVIRMGGDEFVIIVPSFAEFPYEVLLQALTKPFLVDNHRVFISGSIGISTYPEDGTSYEQLLQSADIAMYEAKKQGKNSYRYYTDVENKAYYKEYVFHENDIRRAFANKEFVVHYQPIVNGIDLSVKGMEALVRWKHPERGLLAPGQFLPMIEELCLMDELGMMVLETSLKQMTLWNMGRKTPLLLSVNVAKTQMKNRTFFSRLDAILENIDLQHTPLQLEITEEMLSDHLKTTIDFAEELGKRDIKLALDDFGTGTSNLLYLKEIPINTLKLDQAFVRNLPFAPFDAALFASVHKLCMKLGIELVAEGAETEEQIYFLTKTYPSTIQGFWFSPALAPEDVTIYLAQENERRLI
ncbi:diguanylate cyclase (GGDEF)-like protein [Sinobaca qinghaiensis]|uniref:Diguanylate cyclase (GGDEF)-like protein n=1 Tax=Sinobaca qinghaiensis TaxID=342944 RepID=A0A419UWE1_9BACL|nr:EAL domain-containing protein [Sinobaca qinghaiensis]RKD69447.1 diguanylate cyclase (GGDEF)-like protein [Sinobaca qinghaiensis]